MKLLKWLQRHLWYVVSKEGEVVVAWYDSYLKLHVTKKVWAKRTLRYEFVIGKSSPVKIEFLEAIASLEVMSSLTHSLNHSITFLLFTILSILHEWDMPGISQAYLRPLSDVSRAYLRHIIGPNRDINLIPTPTLVCVLWFTLPLFFWIFYFLVIKIASNPHPILSLPDPNVSLQPPPQP